MKGSRNIEEILGTAAVAPPGRLRERARFSSAEDYAAFVGEAASRPDGYWMSVAAQLAWNETPASGGGPGDWFPGGRLNVSACCLDARVRAGKDREPAILRCENGVSHVSTAFDLLDRVRGVAAAMRRWALEPGERVLVAASGGDAALVGVLSAIRLGLVAVPARPASSREGLARRCEAARCRAVIADRPGHPALDLGFERALIQEEIGEAGDEDEAVPVSAMHPALVIADSAGQIFTIPAAGFLVQALSAYRHLLDGRGPSDRHLLVMPHHHASFLAAAVGALAAGGAVAILDEARLETPDGMSEAIRNTAPRVVVADLPRVEHMASLAAASEPASSGPEDNGTELAVVEGETADPGLAAALRRIPGLASAHVVQVLSRPEAGGYVAGPCPGATPVRPGSVHLPAPGFDLVVVDSRGRDCGPGHGGMLAMRAPSPGTALELQAAPRPVMLEVKARRDRHGNLWTIGEAHVERPGEGCVPLPEIEAVVAGVPGVEQTAVVAWEDASGVRRTRAFVQSVMGDRDSLEREIRRAIAERLGECAVPDGVQIVARLPVSRTGKLLRSVLRSISAGRELDPSSLEAVTDPSVVDDLVHGSDR